MGSLKREIAIQRITKNPGMAGTILPQLVIFIAVALLFFHSQQTLARAEMNAQEIEPKISKRSVVQIQRRFVDIQRRFQQFHQMVQSTPFSTFHISSLNNFKKKIQHFNNMMTALTKMSWKC